MIVFVDAIIKTANYKHIDELKLVLGREFKIKDQGQIKYFLTMALTQQKYTLDLLLVRV